MNLHPIFQAALAPITPPSQEVWRRRQAEIEQADQENDEPSDCAACNGTGEGQTDDTVCGVCRGRGVVR